MFVKTMMTKLKIQGICELFPRRNANQLIPDVTIFNNRNCVLIIII